MADIFYTQAKKEIADDTIALLTQTIKIMLVNTVYSPVHTDLVVDAGGASDPADAEISTTGYVGGYGGSGRKALTTKTITADVANARAKFSADNLTWTSLATGATIAAAIMIKEGAVNDTTSRLIAYFDLTDTPTNGGDITIAWNAFGLLTF